MHSSCPRKKNENQSIAVGSKTHQESSNEKKNENGKTDRRRPDLFFCVRRWRLQGRAPGRRRRHRTAPRPAAEAVSFVFVASNLSNLGRQRERLGVKRNPALTSSSLFSLFSNPTSSSTHP